MAGNLYAGWSGGFSRAIGPRRSADRLLLRNDGVGAADRCTSPLSRARGGIFSASRCAAISARRNLARLFHEVLGIEPAPQKNASCFGKIAEARRKQASRQDLPGWTEGSGDIIAAGAVQRCLLA